MLKAILSVVFPLSVATAFLTPAIALSEPASLKHLTQVIYKSPNFEAPPRGLAPVLTEGSEGSPCAHLVGDPTNPELRTAIEMYRQLKHQDWDKLVAGDSSLIRWAQSRNHHIAYSMEPLFRHLEKIVAHFGRQVLLVFDFDEVLFEARKSRQTFYDRAEREGTSTHRAEYYKFINDNPELVKPPEEITAKLFSQISQIIPSLIITGRRPGYGPVTELTGQILGLNFPSPPFFSKELETPIKEALEKDNPEKEFPVLYQNGIFYTSTGNKGVVLQTILKHIRFHPKHIVAVDDEPLAIAQYHAAFHNSAYSIETIRYLGPGGLTP